MTLLSICQDAADEIGISRPSSIIGNTDTEAQKLLRYTNKIGNRLMKKVDWQALRVEKTFTALNQEAQTGIIPADFDRFVPETFWDRTNQFLISGPISSTEWNSMKGIRNSLGRKFIYRGGIVSVYPIFSGGQNVAFEYITSYWAETSGGTAKARFTLDTDVARIDEELITQGVVYAYLMGEGLPYQKAEQDFKEHFETLLDNDQPDSGVMMSGDIFGGGRHFTGEPGSESGGVSGDSVGSFWNDQSGLWDD